MNRLAAGLLAFLGAGQVTEVLAQWPEKPVEFVIGFAAGGGADSTFLPMKPLLEEQLGQPVLYVYKPGADGQLGWEYLHQNGADGYTIANLSLPHLAASVVLRDPSYTLEDIVPVGIVTGDVPVWFVRNDSPYQDLNDVLEDARKRPGEVTIAIGSFSGEHYITALSLEEQAGVDFRFVNTRGGGKVVSNVLGGHMDVGLARPSVIAGILSEVRGIALLADERHRLLPDTATFDEQLPDDIRIPKLQATRGIVVSRAFQESNPEGFERLVEAVKHVADSPEYAAALERLGLDLNYMPPEEAAAYIAETRDEIEQYKDLLETEE